jgi:hypothetical protein
LPDTEVPVLTYLRQRQCRVNMLLYDHGRTLWLRDSVEKITHWMPLPDPPEEKL